MCFGKPTLELALPEKLVIFGIEVLAPEEQHVYSPSFLIYPAPVGAACKQKRSDHLALRWSAQVGES